MGKKPKKQRRLTKQGREHQVVLFHVTDYVCVLLRLKTLRCIDV